MSPDTYRIRVAMPGDAQAVIGLRIHAAQWLARSGVEQWTVQATGERNIRSQIESGRTFVVEDGSGAIIASLAIDGGDSAFWTTEELREPALYLYKFMIDSSHRGNGLGDVLLDWACRRAAQMGALWLRLDCWKTNTRLHRYYLDRGFKHLDTRSAEGRESGALFERPTDRLLAEPTMLNLVDATGMSVSFSGGDLTMEDRWDPKGEAAVWYEAAELVANLKREPTGDDVETWNTALEQAARTLDLRAREIRQSNGMYYRPLTGNPQED